MDIAFRVRDQSGGDADGLIQAIDACLAQWGDDPAYKNVGHKLEQAKYELDSLNSSPGHRAAVRAAVPPESKPSSKVNLPALSSSPEPQKARQYK